MITTRGRGPVDLVQDISTGPHAQALVRAHGLVVATVHVQAQAALDGAVAENLLTILRDRGEALAQVYQEAGQIDLGMLLDPPIPLHPAAEAWMRAHSAGGRP